MPEIVEWSDFASQESKGNKRGEINRLRLESEKTYKVRFIGPPLKFFKYFVAGKSAICSDPETCPVRAKYGIEPGVRYAVNVFDRNDIDPKTGIPVLKIMECPATVLKPVVTWQKAAGQDPGGKAGPDFYIEVTGKQKNTRYGTTALQVTPLTEDEKEYARAHIYDLAKIYKPVPENEIEQKLFSKEEAPQAQRQPEPVVARSGRPAQDLPF